VLAGSTSITSGKILKAGSEATFSVKPTSCKFQPILSVKQDISGFVEFDFACKQDTTPSPCLGMPTQIDVSVVSKDNFEKFATSGGSGYVIKKTINITSRETIFVKKDSTILIHPNTTLHNNYDAVFFKTNGLYVKTTPRPAIYCPATLFKMQKNIMCNLDSTEFCKVDPGYCQLVTKSGSSDNHKCECVDNEFLTKWKTAFTISTGNNPEYSIDLAAIPESSELYEIHGLTQNNKWIKIGKITLISKFTASEFGDRHLFFQHADR
jgi:hypothetical protein